MQAGVLNRPSLAVRALYVATYMLGLTALAYWIQRRRQIAVTFHHVIPDDQVDGAFHLGNAVSASQFRVQLLRISTRFRTTTEIGRAGTCVITFDDGYMNNYAVAAPILREFDARAYFFVPLVILRDRRMLWIDELLYWISYVKEGSYAVFPDLFLEVDRARLAHSWGRLWAWLMANYERRDELVRRLREDFPVTEGACPGALYANRFGLVGAAEIDEMKREGHLIGAHSVLHDVLALSRSTDALDADFEACAARIGREYNTDVYSYPFGGEREVNDVVISACRRSRFRKAFVNCDAFEPGDFTLARMELGGATDRFTIDARLSGLEHALKKFFRRA